MECVSAILAVSHRVIAQVIACELLRSCEVELLRAAMGCGASSRQTDWMTAQVECHMAKDAVVLVSEPSKLKDERETVLQAVKLAPCAIQLADSKYKTDKEIMLVVLGQNGRMLREAGDQLIVDPEVVTMAVSQFGQALEYADDTMKDHKAVVMAAVQQVRHPCGGTQPRPHPPPAAVTRQLKRSRRAGVCSGRLVYPVRDEHPAGGRGGLHRRCGAASEGAALRAPELAAGLGVGQAGRWRERPGSGQAVLAESQCARPPKP